MKPLLTITLLLLALSTSSNGVRGYRHRITIDGRVYQSDSVWCETGRRYQTDLWIGADGIYYGIKTRKQ
jgi:hypothetical protein